MSNIRAPTWEFKTYLAGHDVVLRSCLEQAKEKGWKNITISLDSPARSFSTYTWKEMMDQYGVGGGPEFLPSFDIKPRPMGDNEKLLLDEIVKECSRKNEAYIFDLSSSEFTRNTIVDAFMVGAMQSYKADMFLAQQQQMTGRLGHEPVDFAVLDRIHQIQTLGVTEVKKDDHVQGLAQNMGQLDAAGQQKKRKRAEADDDDEGETLHTPQVIRYCNRCIQVEVRGVHAGSRRHPDLLNKGSFERPQNRGWRLGKEGGCRNSLWLYSFAL